MSYAEQAAQYNDEAFNERARMCIREQGAIFGNDGRPDIAALGRDVTIGDGRAIDALTMAVCTGPSWADLDQDPALLSAVQAVWPTVAAALHPAAPG